MENLFNNKTKTDIFKQIQYDLLELQENADDEEINNIFEKIPPDFLNNKDDIMIICQLFAYYSRNNCRTKKGNVIKLLEKIIEPMKIHLQDESSFFWFIFGGLWLYEEGLISIEKIINATRQDDSLKVTEYFLPEIIEKETEIFEKEIKNKFEPIKYTKEYINEFKELRKKHFKWLRNSGDFHDPSYLEIEKNPLRLSIKPMT